MVCFCLMPSMKSGWTVLKQGILLCIVSGNGGSGRVNIHANFGFDCQDILS